MDRRHFLSAETAAATMVASSGFDPWTRAETTTGSVNPIPKRKLGKTGEELSIVAFAGIVVMDNSPSFASNIVAEAVDRGINYFDVAPTYGNAQERLGPALEPYRQKVFLACKEEDWTKEGCAKLLNESSWNTIGVLRFASSDKQNERENARIFVVTRAPHEVTRCNSPFPFRSPSGPYACRLA